MIKYIYLTVVFPFIGFLINGLLGSRIKNEKTIGIIGSTAIGISFLISLWAFVETLFLPANNRSNVVTLFNWLNTGGLIVNISYLVDQLSLVMILIITGVGFLIHIYSIGYMHGDKSIWRFFSYLNLFIFAMMNLVLADNFVLLFLGWEGVGLCSYLLIGFWYDRKFERGTTSQAAKKAFVVNRIGDFGFLLGMFLIYLTFDSLNFREVFAKAELFPVSEVTFSFIALFLFLGATGKSAQIPLFVWLPDAMAGPTPVSALIHAATMVTAGVYMVARCSIIFASAPAIMTVIAIIGIFTALMAATIGIVQNDIKKVLAYSTVSQLGYMFLAMGVGAFSTGIFHVMTHAFFKALLFLGAGSVIHGMHDEQNIQKYGGLKRYMPKTYITFLIAALAISGVPGLSGFFSKDEILWYSYANGSMLLWGIGVLTSLITAFYMFRLLSLTFLGRERFSRDIHPHESSWWMTTPLMVLAVLSVIGGYIGLPEVFGRNILHEWFSPVFRSAQRRLEIYGTHSHFEEVLLMTVSAVAAVTSVLFSIFVYTKRVDIANKTAIKLSGFYKLLLNKYYVDEIYEKVFVQPIEKGSESVLWKITDNKIIDGSVNGIAVIIGRSADYLKRFQTGIAQHYATLMMVGIAAALFWIIYNL